MGYLLVGILLLITAVLPAHAELSDDQIYDDIYLRIKRRIFDREPWEHARNGGYLLQFSANIIGDEEEEVFLSNTMFLDGTRGLWTMFSGGDTIGVFTLSRTGVIVLNKEESAQVRDQSLSENRVIREYKDVASPYYNINDLIEQWKRAGKMIRPKIKAILLADFLSGIREWKVVDLINHDTVLDVNSSRRGHFVLNSDMARLSEMDFTPEEAVDLLQSNMRLAWLYPDKRKPPEVALELLQSSMRASAEAKSDAALTTQELFVINTQEVVTIPLSSVLSKSEEPSSVAPEKVPDLDVVTKLKEGQAESDQEGGEEENFRVKIGPGEFRVIFRDSINGNYENLESSSLIWTLNLDKAKLIWTLNNIFEPVIDSDLSVLIADSYYFKNGFESKTWYRYQILRGKDIVPRF